MDIQTATAAPIVKVFGDYTYLFNRLTMRDLGVLANKKQQIDSNNIQAKLNALKDSDLSNSEIISAVNDYSGVDNHSEIIAWVYKTQGAMATLELALEDGDIDVLLESVDHVELTTLALVLIGAFTYEEEEEDVKKNTEADQR